MNESIKLKLSYKIKKKQFEFACTNYQQLCRFCLGTESLSIVYNQAESSPHEGSSSSWTYNANIGSILEKQYFRFVPEEEYGLPNKICDRCVEILVQWNRFQETFIATTQILLQVRDHFETKKTKPSVQKYTGEAVENRVLPECSVDGYEIKVLDEQTSEDFDASETFQDEIEIEEQKPMVVVYDNQPNFEQIIVTKEEYLEPESDEDEGEDDSVEELTNEESNESTQQSNMQGENSSSVGERFKCHECDDSFSFQSALNHHIRRVHKPLLTNTCEICGKKYTSVAGLKVHVKIHDNIEHKCEVCGKVFQLLIYLQRHMAMHAEKKLSCSVCGKLFRFRCVLKRHMTLHTGERPYKCEYCPKAFRFYNNLKEHLPTHTKVKEFKCTLCPAEFALKSSFKRHTMKLHPESVNT